MKNEEEKKGLMAALDELPLFPLPQVVLFPRALLPLHVFEPRYRAMLKDVVETHGALAIALLDSSGEVDEHGHPKIASVCGAGIVVEHQTMPDGRSNILVHGTARVQIVELPFVPPYRRAKATILEDVHSTEISAHTRADDRTALLAAATAFSSEVHKRDPNFSFRLPPNLESAALADLCAHHLIVDAHVRQSLLEERDVDVRVQTVIRELAMQQHSLMKDSGGVLH
jgi:ATP-dependent Lon protease